jgi:hypothetical protein
VKIRTDFQFSQSSLQDYLDCQRRFELRYLLHVEWPALQSEPVIEQEEHMELGHRFHQMIQQHLLGIPEENLVHPDGADEADIQRWWLNYRQSAPLDDLPERRYPEYTLTMPFTGYRLLAKFDLLAIRPGQNAVILDWKTSRKRQSGTTLRKRIQSHVYPFVLTAAGAILNGGVSIRPEQIEMIYWFPEFPDHPERFSYTSADYQADQELLSRIVQDIAGREEGQFFPTEQEKQCEFCVYRSLCSRGARPGNWKNDEQDLSGADSDFETKPDLDFNFDQIGEISF